MYEKSDLLKGGKYSRTSSPVKALPPVSDLNHFLGLTVKDFPLFLTSCKRSLDAFSDF